MTPRDMLLLCRCKCKLSLRVCWTWQGPPPGATSLRSCIAMQLNQWRWTALSTLLVPRGGMIYIATTRVKVRAFAMDRVSIPSSLPGHSMTARLHCCWAHFGLHGRPLAFQASSLAGCRAHSFGGTSGLPLSLPALAVAASDCAPPEAPPVLPGVCAEPAPGAGPPNSGSGGLPDTLQAPQARAVLLLAGQSGTR